MIELGLTTTMTDEYKIGRVGNMKNKKHSEEAKLKISQSNKMTSKTWLIGRKFSDESKRKRKQTNIMNRLKNPEKYHNIDIFKSNRMKQLHYDGVVSVKGDKTPRYGVKLSNEQKAKQSESMQRRFNNGYTHYEMCVNFLIPSIKQTPDTIDNLLQKYNFCKLRPGYIKKIIKEIDPNFNFSLILKPKIIKSEIQNIKHSENLQRKYNNGLTHLEIYTQYI